MKTERILFIIWLVVLIAILYFGMIKPADAYVDLTQCTVNNQVEVCNQSLEKENEVVKIDIVETKKNKLTLEDFINELVQIVKERKAENDIVITSYFEDDNSAILIENKNEMRCINGLCAPEKEWR